MNSFTLFEKNTTTFLTYPSKIHCYLKINFSFSKLSLYLNLDDNLSENIPHKYQNIFSKKMKMILQFYILQKRQKLIWIFVFGNSWIPVSTQILAVFLNCNQFSNILLLWNPLMKSYLLLLWHYCYVYIFYYCRFFCHF